MCNHRGPIQAELFCRQSSRVHIFICIYIYIYIPHPVCHYYVSLRRQMRIHLGPSTLWKNCATIKIQIRKDGTPHPDKARAVLPPVETRRCRDVNFLCQVPLHSSSCHMQFHSVTCHSLVTTVCAPVYLSR